MFREFREVSHTAHRSPKAAFGQFDIDAWAAQHLTSPDRFWVAYDGKRLKYLALPTGVEPCFRLERAASTNKSTGMEMVLSLIPRTLMDRGCNSSHHHCAARVVDFVGPAAVHSFGPVMRFAAGAKFTLRRIASHLAATAGKYLSSMRKGPLIVKSGRTVLTRLRVRRLP